MERGIKENTHPGEILKEEVINAYNLTIKEAAGLLKVSRPTLSHIINGKAAISPNMAIRISRVFGGNPRFWLRLQSGFNLRQAERDLENNPLSLERFKPTY